MKTVVLALGITLVNSNIAFSGIERSIPEKEDTQRLLEGSKELINIDEMERLNLLSGVTSLDLWSGSYWPTYQGGLGARYREPKIAELINKKTQFKFHQEIFQATPLYKVERNNLSPAEKYDLLVGDPLMSLTTYAWKMGEDAESNGRVPMWRGLCDGWASASQKMPRPVKSVTLIAADGRPITFFPEDIKALGTQLYARAKKEVIFLGKRCNSKLGGGCTPFNPAAYHKALVNRIGIQKKTFNNDMNAGKEVWNYPIKNYNIRYYNIFSGQEYYSYKEAMEIYDGSRRFKNRNKLSKNTYALVGVKNEVGVADMRTAHHNEHDNITFDRNKTNTYKYVLELDNNLNIIGGEWVSRGVDFIWRAEADTYPLSFAERKITPVTAEEIRAAAQLSSPRGQPLTIFVRELFERSKK